ncbi:MAG: glycoside hydrolase family 127 protein [Sedimentisphaerales bacterium]|nr:glycoside hydrolase family 127 protein [Sedimentisphaerales bacterium]
MAHRERAFPWLLGAILTVAACATWCQAGEKPDALAHDYHVKPVPFNLVHVADGFWTPRLDTSRRVTIPYAFAMCEQTGRIRNFERAAGLRPGQHEGIYFDDSDVYKVMEGAAYALQVNPDTMMRLYLEKLITTMRAAQWDDGYLYTFYSVPERQPEKRWTNVQSMHEQYCVGHMYEAAVAHYQVTGDTSFLKIATDNADLICRTFAPGKRTDPSGHEEIEIALCKLYRATGDERYLDEAKFLLDQRGRRGNRGPNGNGGLYGVYAQDHEPVTQQTQAVGHSVRAAYLYTGMADVAALTGNMDYVRAIDAIWQDTVSTKLYVTGGIGASGGNEGFSEPYELPNATAYCETCASIANVLWNHRMFLMHDDARYIDVLERTLYNAALSGISMEGDRFFYPNPLESTGSERSPWFACACCPSNVARFIPSVPGYAYAYQDSDVYVNLFVGGDATIATASNKVTLAQQTRYPWDGAVTITVAPEKSESFAVCVRIPGWARNEAVPSDLYAFQRTSDEKAQLKINGKLVPLDVQRGFARIERTWQKGDTIELNLPMPVRRIIANEKVAADRGKVALQRGPLVFCLEGPDNDGQVLNLVIPDDAQFTTEHRPDLLNGVTVIMGQARATKRTMNGDIVLTTERTFTAIPYYAWAHRGRAAMTVWPAREMQAARPEPADTLAYVSRTTASFVHKSLASITDQVIPPNSRDNSLGQLDFWPHKGTTEWIQFAWDRRDAKSCVSTVKVYWFDDTGQGECHLPKSWRLRYRDASGTFQPVVNKTPYGLELDTFNTVTFDPVETDALKIEIVLQEGWSAGVQEVIIE